MRKVIIALHLFLAAFLMFSKGIPPVKRAKLHFIAQAAPPRPKNEILTLPKEAKAAPVTAAKNRPTPETKKTQPPPKPAHKKEVKPTPAKKTKEVSPKEIASKEKAKKEKIAKEVSVEEVRTKELESLKKIESLLEELQAPPLPVKKKSSPKRTDPFKALPAIETIQEGISQAIFDGESFQELLFGELQLPQAGEVELELEIEDGRLRIAKTIQSQSDENLAYLLKKIPQIELGNCKKIAGLENGMRLRIVFCTKPK